MFMGWAVINKTFGIPVQEHDGRVELYGTREEARRKAREMKADFGEEYIVRKVSATFEQD